MLIPLIPKDPDRSDFTCRDGEIEFAARISRDSSSSEGESEPYGAVAVCSGGAAVSITPLHDYPTANIRIPLESGDRPKAELILSGQISRVDPATAERLTLAIVRQAAQSLLDISTDLRRRGLFILPFRVFTIIQLADGSLSFPSPQAVALPADFPPHPEITAASLTDDSLTLALRFPVRPHRLLVAPSADIHSGGLVRTFISYPLYIPDPKEMRGSIGGVRTPAGDTATGVRFGFLTASAIKASVASPEKYYEMVGNERTGYRISSKAVSAPDYSCLAASSGVVPFPRESLLALGEGVPVDTDPLDWIADWVKAECVATVTKQENTNAEGFLPAFLPHKYWHSDGTDLSETSDSSVLSDWTDVSEALAGIAGIDADFIRATAESLGTSCLVLTRPMTFATDSASRRNATAGGIRTLRVLGLPPDSPAHAILYGSDDAVRWRPLRRFDPRLRASLLTPPRLFWRLLLFASSTRCALEVNM